MINHYNQEVRFATFQAGGFITAIVVNPPERKLAKRTSVHCAAGCTAKCSTVFLLTPFNAKPNYCAGFWLCWLTAFSACPAVLQCSGTSTVPW